VLPYGILVTWKSPLTERVDSGDVVPTPTFPFASTVNSDVVAPPILVVEATSKSTEELPSDPSTDSLACGEEVPIPSLVFVLSQNRLALFCVIAPPVVTNGIDPTVSPVIAREVVVALVMTPLVAKKLVEEAFVRNALVEPRLVLVPLAIIALDAKRLVEDARVLKSVVLVLFVITEVEA
jgi:hypothetical protein